MWTDVCKKLGAKVEEKKAESKTLVLKGEIIRSLEALRENFDAEEVLAALEDGSLTAFLHSYYYEREAREISRLSKNNKDALKKICDTLHINYIEQASVRVPEVEERLEMLLQFTTDEEVLQDFRIVALNQEEMAKLLDEGETVIYLCHNTFSIPLGKKGIQYIGVDNPVIENPFTQEQYSRAGITVVNISLPTQVDASAEEYARRVARENGYDDYADIHSALATYFHEKLKDDNCFSPMRLSYIQTGLLDRFRSEYAAKQKVRELLKRAYDEAQAYFNPNAAKSLAETMAKKYIQKIEDAFSAVLGDLEDVYKKDGKNRAFERLFRLVAHSEENFLRSFKEELEDNQDYYNMYDFNYFVEKVNVEEHDYRISEGIKKILEGFSSDNIEYTICVDDFFKAVEELEQDLNEHAASFYNIVHGKYLAYVREIEECLEIFDGRCPDFEAEESIYDYLARIS